MPGGVCGAEVVAFHIVHWYFACEEGYSFFLQGLKYAAFKVGVVHGKPRQRIFLRLVVVLHFNLLHDEPVLARVEPA